MPDSSAVAGCLLGMAVGDALGLAYEGLSARRARRLLGPPTRYRLLFGRGLVSDDTEHAALVAQSLIASAGDPLRFDRELASRLRWWFAALPAGIGLATLRSCLKLWLGLGPNRSGVFSAGNGPCMRAPILGAAVDDADRLGELVALSTRMTHTDPRARQGAMVVAWAARTSAEGSPVDGSSFLAALRALPGALDDEFEILLTAAVDSASRGESTVEFVAARGWKRGVSGYVYQTVPAVVQAWLSHPDDFRSAVTSVIDCGGDTDTVAAIVGGIVGARVGSEGIPEEWRRNLGDWPLTSNWLARLAESLHESLTLGTTRRPPSLPFPFRLVRNLGFMALVLLHGFRRLLPPY